MTRAAWFAVCIAATVAFAVPAHAQVSTVDLLIDPGAQIDGAAAGDRLGKGGGDFRFDADADGDVIVGAAAASPAGRAGAGSAWVVLGQLPSLLDLLTAATAVRIDGAAAGDRTGVSVAPAGDVNGDGRDDAVIGADGADPLGRTDAGTAWVVFGGDTAPVDLAALAGRGFRIDGPAAGADAGSSVDGAGDVNGDGLDDVIVGAPKADHDDRNRAGTAYVVFGKADTAAVDLAALGTGGYPIHGAAARDKAGTAVAGAGNVDGDGFADVIVGAPGADNSDGDVDAGAAFVVFGKANTTPVDLAGLGIAGYRFSGDETDANAGQSVDNAGDVDRDGDDDQIVGAPGAGAALEGAARIVYGHPVTVRPPSIGISGYDIEGDAPGSATGQRVAGLGDVSGDLRPDQAIGAPDSDFSGRTDSGSAYVVYGLEEETTVFLSTYTADKGFRIDGPAAESLAGRSVAGVGGVSGPIGRDVLVGAPGNSANGRESSGSAYVVHGEARLEPVSHLRVRNIHIPGGSREVPGANPSRADSREVSGVNASRAGRGDVGFRLRAPALVRTTVHRQRTGRTRGRFREVGGELVERVRCVPGRAARRRGERRCLRFARVGTAHRLRLAPGRHRLPFDGRVGRRRLEPGRYVLELTARDRRGKVHGPKRAPFRVLR